MATPTPTSTPVAGAGTPEPLDPEKEARKKEKLAEKEAKKEKALQKAAAATAAKEKVANGSAPQSKKVAIAAAADAKKAADAEEEAAALAAVLAAPPGGRKILTGEMLKTYNPKIVEGLWYEWWEQAGFFAPSATPTTKPPFVIVIPPPNVTGSLHLGHALTNSIQDTIIRWRRMCGYNCLWVPGTDHAGIATQSVVEKKLAKESGVTRHQLGRGPFLAEVWKWKEKYGHTITSQLRRLGSSLDWSRERFTMDPLLSRAVGEAFTRFHASGLIYRDNRLVHWCCQLATAISDQEVDVIDVPPRTMLSVPGYPHKVEFGVLTSFAYPLEGGGGEIVVATTRPETMLGDTAVAVHSADPRYSHLHGKFVVHPFGGRRIPIVTDDILVDMAFGTGAVKVTPAHDENDFQVGKRHGLPSLNIFTEDGLVNANGDVFAGMKRFDARVAVVSALTKLGLFRGTADNAMRLGLCSRSKDVIEPLLKPQWWVSCGGMAKAASAAARDGRLEILPKTFEATFLRWMDDIRDWCISRQLWWGHRIPAWYVTPLDRPGGNPEPDAGMRGGVSERMDRWVVAGSEGEAHAAAAKLLPSIPVDRLRVEQDEDVLDTWFSSGLFPFAVFGWPQQTADLARFYPTAVLETGHDIIFFWVARMVMMGMQLTGQVPFKQVYLHAMVRDAHGRKMSKTLGNVIDPLQVIEGITLADLQATLLEGNLPLAEIEKAKAGQAADFPAGIAECGTDALRFALVSYTGQARDVNLDINRVVGYRHWCNKLWNAIRFAMLNLGAAFPPPTSSELGSLAGQPLAARWIMARCNAAAEAIARQMEAYDFASATSSVYAYWQNELCDVFIETMKPVMALPDSTPGAAAAKRHTRVALWRALDAGLRMLHPFMPFLTEELWQRLPGAAESAGVVSIMLAPYPVADPLLVDAAAESDMAAIEAVVKAARAIKARYGLLKTAKPDLFIAAQSPSAARLMAAGAGDVCALAGAGLLYVVPQGPRAAEAIAAVAAGGHAGRLAAALPSQCGTEIVSEDVTLLVLLSGLLDPAEELVKLARKQSEIVTAQELLRKRTAAAGYETKVPEAVRAEDAAKGARLDGEMAAVAAAILDYHKLSLAR